MAVLDIITAPHPLLELRAREVEADEFGAALATHVSNMAETMYAAPGVGLAAPQVSDSRRILVLDPDEREERGRRFFAFVNPRIVERSKETIPWRETCLSVPEFEIEIQRSRRVRVEWQAPEDGSPQTGWFEDFESVIVQHELDHLDGTILLDRASRFKRSRYLKKVAKGSKRERVAVR
ncbi:MAG: peptide deformylase [Myxococcota bacterium]|jgi:peptide deformylase